MNRKYILWGVIGLVLILMVTSYNGMVRSRETTNETWAQVQSAYQRRLDLIDNLVNVVKGSADFEKSTLQDVIEARSKATSININADNLTPEKIQQIQKEQSQLGGAFSKLLAVAENYPQLRTTEAFMKLQDQVEGTENRIKMARDNFSSSVRNYNASIQVFPKNLMAGMFGFKIRAYFESDEGASKAPKVDFSQPKK